MRPGMEYAQNVGTDRASGHTGGLSCTPASQQAQPPPASLSLPSAPAPLEPPESLLQSGFLAAALTPGPTSSWASQTTLLSSDHFSGFHDTTYLLCPPFLHVQLSLPSELQAHMPNRAQGISFGCCAGHLSHVTVHPLSCLLLAMAASQLPTGGAEAPAGPCIPSPPAQDFSAAGRWGIRGSPLAGPSGSHRGHQGSGGHALG